VANERSDIKMELVEEDGMYRLETNVYELCTGFFGKMVHTDVLGMAFEPEQKFENPDGTPIRFDSDYFGNHRGVNVLPGPFAEGCNSYTVKHEK